MSIEHTTRAITENKYLMQLFADKKSLEADIAALKNLKGSNPSDPRTSDYAIKQKEYELSQIENRTKGKDYSSVKNQCEKYFTDNISLFDKNQIITETRGMLAKGQIVNEWPHLAAVFLLDHAVVTDAAKAGLAAVTKPIVVDPIGSSILTPAPIPLPQLSTSDSIGSEETIVPPTRPSVSIKQKPPAAVKYNDKTKKPTVVQNVETSSNIVKQITDAYTDFKNYAIKIDKWGGTFRDSKADIETQQAELNKKIKTLTNLLDTYASHADNTIRDTVASYRLNISYYLVDDLGGIQNNLYKNLGLSQNLAISVLNRDKKRLDPLPEGDDAMYKTIDSLKNTSLGNSIAEAMKQNPNKSFFEIISNPFIKGGWETAYSKVFEKSLNALDTSIDALATDNSLDERQRKALYHLKTIRGKDGWLNFKTENITAMWQGLKVGGAVVAGAAATYASAGLLGPWAAVGIGAVVATGGTTVARGYWDGKETLIDGGINILSFGGGALVVKLGQAVRATTIVSNTGKVGSIATGVGIDGAGNIGIGVIGDNVRADLHGEDLNNWDSLKMNAIPWAIFAIAMNARGMKVPSAIVADAKSVEKSVERIGILSRLGGSSKDELANIASKTPGLKKWGQVEADSYSSTGRHTLDGKEYRWSPKQDAFVGKNGEKYTKEQFEILQAEKAPKIEYKTENKENPASADAKVQPINTLNKPLEPITILNNPALLEKQIEKGFKSLKKDGDTHDFGGMTITKEGKKYRVKSEEGEFLISEKEAILKVKNKLPQDIEKANKYLQDAVTSHVNAIPVGKKMKYSGPEGESVLTKKADGTIEVVGPQGKILKGAELDAFYENQASNILNQKMTSFLQKHGDEKVDPKKFSEWYGKDRSWYNPVTWGKGVINLTWNEVMQPVKTYNAFLGKGGALRTLDNPLAMTNNLAKAIVLRDVNMNWFSTASAMRVIGRGTIMTGATAAAMNTTVGPNIVSQVLMTPTIYGYTQLSGDTNHTYEQHAKMAFSTYYGGMLWGTLLSQAIGGMPDGK